MEFLKLDIQLFSDGKIVIETDLDTKNFENGLNKMKSSSQSAGSTIKNIVVGLGITKLIGKAMSEITGSIDDAVSRFDTLNNFPKVMSNLNISAEESQKSIDKMSDALMGLPTTLDQGAAAVQRFTSKNSDVGKSTDLFLALNNAILAGGASSEIQSSALEQLSQAYAKGKPDMMEWRTAMMAMPAQLKQVAIAMGYVDADALGEALRDGTISMDQFMDTIVKLNTEGANGFKSFDEQARNSTDGIRTSITNMHSRITQGVTAIIDGINKGLKQNKLGSFADLFATVGNTIRDSLKKIAEYIPRIISMLVPVIKTAKDFFGLIGEHLPKIVEIIKSILPLLPPIIAAIVAFQTVTTIISIIESATAAFSAFSAVLIANPIGLVVAAIAVLVTAFVTLWKKSDSFRNFWIGLWKNIKETFTPVIESLVEMFKSAWDLIKVVWDIVGPYFKAIFEIIKVEVKIVKDILVTVFKGTWENIKIVWNAVGPFFKSIFDTITNIFKVIKSVLTGDFKGAWEGIKGVFSGVGSFFKTVLSTITGVFKNVGSTFLGIGKNIVQGIWNGISNASWIKDKIKSWCSNLVKSFTSALKIGSPSKVMESRVGKFVAQGIGTGFVDEIKNVYRKMQNAIDFETSKMNTNVQTSGTYQMAMAGTPIFKLQDNSQNQTQLVVNGKVLAEVVNTENKEREVARA